MSDDATILRMQLADATATALTWRARYMAAHEVLVEVEAVIDSEIGAAVSPPVISRERYIAMRAAFLAYRASIEAGAPLGWAVAEDAG